MERLKVTMSAFKARIERIREFGEAYDVSEAFQAAALEADEATLRQFLAGCTSNEFNLSGYAFLDLALKHGLPFVEYLETLADEKGWTDYLKDMIGEARMEVE